MNVNFFEKILKNVKLNENSEYNIQRDEDKYFRIEQKQKNENMKND